MADWKFITRQADNAKRKMILHQEKGETVFDKLLETHGADGMIFFKRAEAYEALGEKSLALEDYRKASVLFPMDIWKAKAQAGIERTTKQ